LAQPSHLSSQPILVATPAALCDMLDRLLTAPAVAVDTESNSLYVYRERVCLIQLSVPGRDYLVDPFAFSDLAGLGALFASPSIEKVFHAAEYDLIGLKRDYGFDFASLFDTMLASRMLGRRPFGLADLLYQHFGVSLDKRLQRYDWGRRPLVPHAIAYAALDTHYLLPLRDILAAELHARHRWTEAQQRFQRLTQVALPDRSFDPDSFWRLRGAHDLDPTGRAVLRELYLWRDQQAQRLNRPVVKVIPNELLVRLSEVRPRTFAEVSQVPGMTRYLVSRYGRDILAAIRRGLHAPVPRPPPADTSHRPDQATVTRFEALRAWRKARSEQRGVEPDMILSNAALWTLARRPPDTPQALRVIRALDPWQVEAFGAELIALLNAVVSSQ
jgi:ribonuclease D